jgi:hypothetical protein
MENLTHEFIVVTGEDTFNDGQTLFLVNANNEEEALIKYAKQIAINDDDFLYYVYDVSITDGFASNFWVANDYSKNAVFDFFGKHKEFAKVYDNFYASYLKAFDRNEEDFEFESFPKEMLAYIFANTNWTYAKVFDSKRLKRIN